MYVRIKLTFPDTRPRIVVPQSAIQKDQAGSYVLVYDEAGKTAAVRRITTEGTHGVWSIVSEGLQKGERIVVQGLQKVIPGKPFKIEQEGGEK